MVGSFSRRFLGGFVLGAAASSASCLAALQLYERREPQLGERCRLGHWGQWLSFPLIMVLFLSIITRLSLSVPGLQVIGADDVSVPSHLYKVILVRGKGSEQPLAVGAFVVPNSPIGFDRQLPEYQVQLEDLEKMSGLVFFPQLDRDKGLKPLCDVDSCRLIQLHEFKLYIAARRVGGARNLHKLERILAELKEEGITPDDYFLNLYEKKREEFSLQSGTGRDEKKG
eukprot:XP_004915758.1 PREDICTED: nuclease EXOG, mitochondrial [Xenopus tropicalis]